MQGLSVHDSTLSLAAEWDIACLQCTQRNDLHICPVFAVQCCDGHMEEPALLLRHSTKHAASVYASGALKIYGKQ